MRSKWIRGAWWHNGRPLPLWLNFTHTWNAEHEGRFWKRRLSKVRRRAWRDPHTRGLVGIESTVNWKNW